MAAKTALVYSMNAPADLTTAQPVWGYVGDDDLHNVYEFYRSGMSPGQISALTADDLSPHPYFPDQDAIADFDLDRLLHIAVINHSGPNVTQDHASLEEALSYLDSALLPTESSQ